MSEEKFEFAVEDEAPKNASDNKQENNNFAEEQIEIVDDTPPQDRGRKPMSEPPKEFSDDELTSYAENVQKRIKHFTKGYHDERRAKEAALREREEALKLAQSIIEENKRLKSSVNQNQEALLEQAKKAVSFELEKAKEDYKKAYDSGDSDALVAAQESLTSAKIRADKVANFKVQPLQQEEIEVKPVQQNAKPAVDQRAERWRSDNDWFGQDKRMTAYALALHDELINVERLDPTSDDYYQRIDAEMRQRFPERLQSSDATPQKKSNVVAPATRSTAQKKIVLTQTQVNLAKRLGISPEAMAKEVAKLNRGNV